MATMKLSYFTSFRLDNSASYCRSSPSRKNIRLLPCSKIFSPSLNRLQKSSLVLLRKDTHSGRVLAAMATGSLQEVLPPELGSSSDPPPIFDGKTRLYISYICPYAQRVWIARNCKGLQDKIELVAIDLEDRPAWYKEKVYPPNKVPSLEHNNKVLGESLDLIKYIDKHFEGPSLLPDDPAKKVFAEELLSYSDSFNGAVIFSLKGDMTEACAAFDYLEKALSKFNDGPFFLGQFSLVDIAYAPFIERFEPLLLDVKKHDINNGRPELAAWYQEMRKIEAYNQTLRDPVELVEVLKRKFMA
ncbi:protein IN2-1 homolog B-like [Mangifera indica]|uniref:protein IN2-1 homolog B-like n=1 Tax=Mangifera indica TaxID=29780 RepID=UPI001CFB16BC|nr:protein IN2-1 homolog B-like [Mangifera indica]XP_044461475.1 protein IN2-1 homolog B-like [Mangifera indica]XP_044461476.1 protein IN2-1 homolog B-like [Mangifera indica]